jgi:hypothetical protein
MILAWKLSKDLVAVVLRGEPRAVDMMEAAGFSDRCLTYHESQFHIPIDELNQFRHLLGLGRKALAALRFVRPGSDFTAVAGA